MNRRRLHLLGFAAALILSGSFAACTQDFDQFEPDPATFGQGGASSSASTTSAGGSGAATSSGVLSSSSASASGGASSSSSASSAGGGAQSSSSSGTTAMCGDGMQDPGEDCDDGNVTPADGCSATCTSEDPDSCPGPAVPLAPGMFVIQGDTTNAGNDTGATPCGGSQSGDVVYAVTPTQDGTLTATVQGNFATLVYARDACPGMNSQNLDCSQGQMPATISFMVQAGQVVHVFVDGYGGNPEEGPFTLTLDLQ